MACVYKRSKRWWIRYSTNGREYRESAGNCRRDAERALRNRLSEIDKGKFVDVRKRCTVTLSEFTPRFLEWAKAHKRSWKRDELSLKVLRTVLGSKNLEQITSAEVEKYKRTPE